MTLACQKDSYLKSMETKVVSCTVVENHGASPLNYMVILEDTILFPEGGGQPCDYGAVSFSKIQNVRREGNQVIHYTYAPCNVGDTVCILLDWKRRFDHMQQHSGQHLITAVAERILNYSTTGWNLGKDTSYIELSTTSLKPDEMKQLEDEVNEKIRESVPISVHYYEKGSEELKQVNTRFEIPDDQEGPVRVVNIKNVDITTCCGTHVKNTSELQMVKLLHFTKGKKKKINLHFLVGGRVLSYLEKCFSHEKSLCALLGSTPDELCSSVEKLRKSVKTMNKTTFCAIRDIAALEARLFRQIEPHPKFYSLHRINAEFDFMSIFLNYADNKDVLFFLTVGDGKSSGHAILTGPEDLVKKYEPVLTTLLNCKGAIVNNKFQGKFRKYGNLKEVDYNLRRAVNETEDSTASAEI